METGYGFGFLTHQIQSKYESNPAALENQPWHLQYQGFQDIRISILYLLKFYEMTMQHSLWGESFH